MNVSPVFVILMGMGVTFVGLTTLILLVTLMGKACSAVKKSAPVAAAPAAENIPAADKGALIAAVSAAIAEDLGTDVNAFRIVSMKRVA